MLCVSAPKENRSTSRIAPGFTLIEILMALTLVMFISGVLYYGVGALRDRANKQAARLEMRQMQMAIDTYEDDVGQLPPNLDALVTPPQEAERKWDGPYLPKKGKGLKDPWNQKYQYMVPGTDHPYDIYSYGSRQGKKTPKAEWIRPK